MFVKILRGMTGVWLPTLIFLFFYTVTTVIGSLWFMTNSGQTDLFRMLGGMSKEVAADIGSPIYLLVLLLPFVITPAFALVGIRGVQRVSQKESLPRWLVHPEASVVPLMALSFTTVAYCIYRLAINHALVPDVYGSYQENILRRTELFDRLGSLFFLITYGFLPILTVIFLARLMKGRKLIDLIGFLAMYLVFQIVIFDTLAKSHLLVASIMLICAVLIARASIWYIPAIAIASVTCFLTANVLLNGFMQSPSVATSVSSSDSIKIVTPRSSIEASKSGPETNALDTGTETSIRSPDVIRTPRIAVSPSSDSSSALQVVIAPKPPPATFDPVKDIIYRMSTSYPFYIHIFSKPDERCGIEANTVRAVLQLSPSRCSLPIRVFAAMSPEITWVTGYAPAAANISAYGELGFAWSIFVMAISGVILGTLGAITRMGRGPLYVAFGVASCTFGYYLSQLPLIATFTYGHGLVFLTLPTLLLFVASELKLPARLSRAN